MSNGNHDMTDISAPKGAMSRRELARLGGKRLVYVRAVVARDVVRDLSDEDDFVLDVPEDATLYAVHAADGSRLALLGDRDLAFAAARQFEMTPVSVH